MAELVDALGSGSSVGSHVGVRVPSSAPNNIASRGTGHLVPLFNSSLGELVWSTCVARRQSLKTVINIATVGNDGPGNIYPKHIISIYATSSRPSVTKAKK